MTSVVKHPSNASSSIVVTLGGISIVVSDVQSLKALSPIVIRDLLGSTTDNEVQSRNAQLSMIVTLGGILICSNDTQFSNAFVELNLDQVSASIECMWWNTADGWIKTNTSYSLENLDTHRVDENIIRFVGSRRWSPRSHSVAPFSSSHHEIGRRWKAVPWLHPTPGKWWGGNK